MAKKEEPVYTNNNTNNNTNNINVKVDVKQPKRTYTKKKEKPNWVLKAIVIALIGFAVSLLGYYLTNEEGHKPAIIENGSPAIKGKRVN